MSSNNSTRRAWGVVGCVGVCVCDVCGGGRVRGRCVYTTTSTEDRTGRYREWAHNNNSQQHMSVHTTHERLTLMHVDTTQFAQRPLQDSTALSKTQVCSSGPSTHTHTLLRTVIICVLLLPLPIYVPVWPQQAQERQHNHARSSAHTHTHT